MCVNAEWWPVYIKQLLCVAFAGPPTDAPIYVSAEAPPDASTDNQTHATTDAPTDESNAAPPDTPTAVIKDAPTVAPTDATTGAPTDAPTNDTHFRLAYWLVLILLVIVAGTAFIAHRVK